MTSKMTKKVKKTQKNSKPSRSGDSWQAEKSAMTRKSILDATIECFIELGYAKTTTAMIAEYAGVSRGAMMHHFPSRLAVLRAAIEYLHEQRLREYHELMMNIDLPNEQLSREKIRLSVEGAWRYVNLPSFVAYHELLAASRTDPELNDIMQPLERDFEGLFLQTVKEEFPHWAELDILDLCNDLVQFMMRGMALSHMATRRKQRAERMIEYITDSLDQLYTKAAKQQGRTSRSA
jgi:AcrR family transcriptional regulator